MSQLPILSSIAPIAADTDLWFLDIWGVVHDGVRPYRRTVEACRTFRESGGTVLLVTNAPRPNQSVKSQLDGIGVDRSAYDAVVSSGDVSRSLIAEWRGRSVLHIGPERDRPIFSGLGVSPGADAATAEVAVCTGLYDDESETPETYRDMLAALEARDVPMICANPDLKVERGGRIIPCAGAVAHAYEEIGGKVDYAGKPFRPIYDLALRIGSEIRGTPVAKARVLAIGDGVATDIAGAFGFGVRSVYVSSGVHIRSGEDIATAANRLFADASGPRPDAVMSDLVW